MKLLQHFKKVTLITDFFHNFYPRIFIYFFTLFILHTYKKIKIYKKFKKFNIFIDYNYFLFCFCFFSLLLYARNAIFIATVSDKFASPIWSRDHVPDRSHSTSSLIRLALSGLVQYKNKNVRVITQNDILTQSRMSSTH